MKNYLVTGAAGFIGSRTSEMLLDAGHSVVGIDNMNDYYDVELKRHRLKSLKKRKGLTFVEGNIENFATLKKIFRRRKFDAVLNIAARAGVRYSMENPFVYFSTNVMGTVNLLELCRETKVPKFVLSSTSSLYAGQKMPFVETLPVNTPISPYAASKKGAEAAAYTWHYLYGIDVSVVRYFTVYGPAGRPDMSIFIFTKKIDEGQPIEVFGDGNQTRDFSYIDDIAEGTIKSLKKVGFDTFNFGNNKPFKLIEMINLIEKYLGKKAKIIHKPFNKSDMKATWANISKSQKVLGYKPKTGLDEGIRKSVDWYLENRSWLRKVKI